MVTFTIPAGSNGQPSPEFTVTSTQENLTRDQLLGFPAFNIWLSTLQRSLARQRNPNHAFHKKPYFLRRIDIQAVDYFGGGRLGFVKMKADVSNDVGEKLPGSVFLRGGSVGILLVLQPNDVDEVSEEENHVIMTVQPRIPAGSLEFLEIPAGMLDDQGTFAGGAAKEIQEETGLVIPQEELIDMTSLALASSQRDQQGRHEDDQECLQKGVYPSPGGCDEFIPLFLCKKRLPREEIRALQGRLTGLRDHGEKITLKIVPLKDLWKVGLRDGKALAAWALYNGLKQDGLI
ncbi:hypothetical protein VTN49DRAFT_5025 [Thermomyces lanuginosus]|uniref:uncharacterized protein n=1 Tax=Thermomyces lanuginosus TaxID=5541 RepID=UPI003742D328